MTHGKINEIQDILTEVDTLLPTKLAALGMRSITYCWRSRPHYKVA